MDVNEGERLLPSNCSEPLETSISDMEGEHQGCNMLYSHSRSAFYHPM